jgi:signal transduction histidine kinase/Na+-transporting methylmalonyl-CoA/oxaloacetate decarboxylase gamma subunit
MDWPREMRRTLAWCATAKGVIFAVLIVLAAIAWFFGQHLNRGAEQQADDAASRLAAALALDVGRDVEQLDLVLQTAVSGRQPPADPALTPQERNTLLFDRTPRDRYLDFIEVLDAEGSVLASVPPRAEPRNWAMSDYFGALRSATSSGVFVGRPVGIARPDKAAFTISRRITDRDGAFTGVVVIGQRLAYFRDLFAGLGLGPHDTVTLLRNDGVILMRMPFDPNDIGRTVDAASPLHAFIQGGPGTIAERDPHDGIERRFVSRRAGTLPLTVAVGIAPQRGNGWWIAAMAAAAAVAAALLTLRMAGAGRAVKTAERESREKSRFLTMLSHELRTPLHGVLGYAEQLSMDGGLSARQTHRLSQIVAAASHMRDVVGSVLDYARVEALGPELRPTRIDIRRLVMDCIDTYDRPARARQLQISFAAKPGAPTHFVTVRRPASADPDEPAEQRGEIHPRRHDRGAAGRRRESHHAGGCRYRHRHSRVAAAPPVRGIRALRRR